VINDFALWLGIDAWRPALTALLLPPVPFLVMILLGARLMFSRRLLAWLLVLLGCAGVWASTSNAVGQGLRQWLLPPTLALSSSEIAELKRAPKTAIVILGGGSLPLAPEYGVSDLAPLAVDRLRFGLWLARETQLPVLFSGGLAHGAGSGTGTLSTEAEIAARVAERDFGRSLKWVETKSRDTRENALRSVALLREQGIERIVLVTHAYHMPRAQRNFERALGLSDGTSTRAVLVPAPLGVPNAGAPHRLVDYLPSRGGSTEVRLVLQEWLGRLIGA
jgi:uncharacterized SAM-binding protein YcdF (DUF218 family)